MGLSYGRIIVRTAMNANVFEDQHLRDNKFFGQFVGVWPKQEKYTKYSIRVVTFLIYTLSNAAQISQVVVFFSLDVLTDQLPFLVLGFGINLKQYNYVLNENKLKKLLNGIVADWLTERSDEESAILEMYYKRATYFSNFYKATIGSCTLAFLMLPACAPIQDIVAPLNVTRPRVLLYPSYYFVDEQQYYYPILAHMVASAFLLAFVFIACDINLLHIVQHACALIAISGHRFKHATDDMDFHEQKGRRWIMDESYERMSRSIDAHKKAIEYVELVEACHVHCFFFTVGMVVLVMAVTFVKLSTMELSTAYFTYCAFTVAQLIHLFFLTYMGQFVIDSNDEIVDQISEACWYNCPTKTQSLYVLVLRKCLNPPRLTGGGIISLNLDSFVKILKASVSYYTVLKSS